MHDAAATLLKEAFSNISSFNFRDFEDVNTKWYIVHLYFLPVRGLESFDKNKSMNLLKETYFNNYLT